MGSVTDLHHDPSSELHRQLHAVIDRLLAEDVDGLDDDEVHQTLVSLQRADSRLCAVSSRYAQVWDNRKIWADDGSKSAGARLAREANLSGPHAAAIIRRARQLSRMPATTEALAQGEVSSRHVDILATANAHDWSDASFAESEPMLVGFCRTLRFPQARQAIDYWIARADPHGDTERGQRTCQRRHLTASPTLDGLVHLNGLLDPIGGRAVLDELTQLEKQLFQVDQRTGNRRTTTQRRADALVEMAHRSRTSAPGGLRPRPLLTILCGEESFRHICELADGQRVSPSQVVPWLSHADIERIVFDGPDRVMSVSRKRSFTGALRRAIEVRDRICQHPSGCDTPASECDVDHRLPHSEGGLTSQENGRLRCPTHNRDETRRNLRPRPSRADSQADNPEKPDDPDDHTGRRHGRESPW